MLGTALSGLTSGSSHDGDEQVGAWADRAFRPGDVVKANFRQGQWYLATVEHDNGDGTYTVAWLDGDVSNCRKHSSELRLMRFHVGLERYEECIADQSGTHPSVKMKDGPTHWGPLRVGDVVKAPFRHNETYLATIERDNGDGTCSIAWFDGDASERTKRPEELTLMRFDAQLRRFQEDARPLLEKHGCCALELRMAQAKEMLQVRGKGTAGASGVHSSEVLEEQLGGDHEPLGSCHILGWWDSFECLSKMTWDSKESRYWFRVQMTRREVSFQILVGGTSSEKRIYPSVNDAGPHVPHRAMGPDHGGQGVYWSIGRDPREGSREGVWYHIVLHCPVDGPLSVTWAKLSEPQRPCASPSLSAAGETHGNWAFIPPAHRQQGRKQLAFLCKDGLEQREPCPDLSKFEHWRVEGMNGAMIHRKHDQSSPALCVLLQGDIIVRGDQFVDLMRVGSQEWLPLLPGTKIYRQGFRIFGDLQLGGSFVIARDGEAMHLIKMSAGASEAVVLRLVAGFGEPWVVEYEQVPVRRGPSIGEEFVGVVNKGDVIGVQRRTADWVELVPDADVWLLQGARSVNAIRTYTARWSGREYTLSTWHSTRPSASQSEDTSSDTAPGPAPWMMVNHPTHGQLLRRCQEPPTSLGGACIISQQRRAMYVDVVGLIRRRIYEDNLEELWEGEYDKLPSLEKLEEKLFSADITVIHATVDDRLAGGAIVREVRVRARAGSDRFSGGEDGEVTGNTTVGYIDSCAATPGMHAGSAIWGALIAMDFVCLACHSILLKSTVSFWKSRGMLCFDSSKLEDRWLFEEAIRISTGGRVICELVDLQRALPFSKLPLFVWTRPAHCGTLDPSCSYVFTPDAKTEQL